MGDQRRLHVLQRAEPHTTLGRWKHVQRNTVYTARECARAAGAQSDFQARTMPEMRHAHGLGHGLLLEAKVQWCTDVPRREDGDIVLQRPRGAEEVPLRALLRYTPGRPALA